MLTPRLTGLEELAIRIGRATGTFPAMWFFAMLSAIGAVFILIFEAYEVLVEGPSKKDPEYLTARTRGNYILHFRGGADLHGELVDVRVTGYSPITLRGEIAG